MMNLRDYQNLCYEDRLDSIDHFKPEFYPELKPWVGDRYREKRILVLLESAYLTNKPTERERFYYDDNEWYTGRVDLADRADWMDNRIIACKQEEKHTQQKYIGIALTECRFLSGQSVDRHNAWRWIAFMNFFQKPANIPNTSQFERGSLDIFSSNQVLCEVAKGLSAQVVVFASALAWKSADIARARLKVNGIYPVKSKYPNEEHWEDGGGKQMFIDGINKFTKV